MNVPYTGIWNNSTWGESSKNRGKIFLREFLYDSKATSLWATLVEWVRKQTEDFLANCGATNLPQSSYHRSNDSEQSPPNEDV